MKESKPDNKGEREQKKGEKEHKKGTELLLLIKEAPGKLVLMAVLGILILVLSVPEIWNGWSAGKKQDNEAASETADYTEDGDSSYIKEMERKLEDMLESIDGVEKASVMLTLKSTKEEVTEKNRPYSQDNSHSKEENKDEGSSRLEMGDETIFTETEDGRNVPFVVKELSPEVEGVLVVMEGADDASLKTEIIEGIEVLFDLPVHKIKVIRMKTAETSMSR